MFSLIVAPNRQQGLQALIYVFVLDLHKYVTVMKSNMNILLFADVWFRFNLCFDGFNYGPHISTSQIIQHEVTNGFKSVCLNPQLQIDFSW